MGIWTHFQSIAVAKERLREITGLRRESRIAAPALRLRSNTIELRGVGVAYGKKIVLDAVDLEVAAGEAIGISGGNGAGKSTLLRTIAGLIEPDSGRVLVGGVDLSSGNPRSLEGQLAYLPQSSTLVSGTIVDNLTLFRPERAQAALSAAAELELDTHIARLPRGYETWVGGNAEMLAGGVRQSIALARALAGAPRIILFDEANAALDHGSDEALRFALEHRKHTGSTLVIVSHRPSFLRLADRRFELVDGKLVDVAPPPPREALRDLAA
jgi:ATP-binding cassette subfamily C protein LapB